MNKVEIKELNLLSADERGSTYEIEAKNPNGYLLAYRKAGSISGNHWHIGKTEGKNPETLLLISGTVDLYTSDINQENPANQKITGPAEISIPSFTFHRLTAISDCCFLEFNSLEEHKVDTVYPKN